MNLVEKYINNRTLLSRLTISPDNFSSAVPISVLSLNNDFDYNIEVATTSSVDILENSIRSDITDIIVENERQNSILSDIQNRIDGIELSYVRQTDFSSLVNYIIRNELSSDTISSLSSALNINNGTN